MDELPPEEPSNPPPDSAPASIPKPGNYSRLIKKMRTELLKWEADYKLLKNKNTALKWHKLRESNPRRSRIVKLFEGFEILRDHQL